MRYILSLLMISALALLMGCQNAQSSTTETKNENPAPADKAVEKAEKTTESADDGHNHGDEAPRINLADAKKDFDAGEVIFIDTRSAVSFKQEHIKGAISVPAGQFEKAYKNVPKDKKIIAYCS
jgi:3-mercaptopyruvate sulfurtransferase SseA